MRVKVEKTEAGKVKAVAPKKRRVSYGTVVKEEQKFVHEGEYTGPTSKLPPEEVNPTHEGGSGKGGESGDTEGHTELPSSVEHEAEEAPVKEEKGTTASEKMFEDLMESMLEDMRRRKEQEQEDKKEKSEEEKKEQEKKKQEERSKKSRNDMLTEYLVMQLRLRALAEVLGATKVATVGTEYFSLLVAQGETLQVYGTSPAKKQVILDIDTFPYFDSAEKAQAFLELCHPILNRYCHLMANLNPVAVIAIPDIEVIHS